MRTKTFQKPSWIVGATIGSVLVGVVMALTILGPGSLTAFACTVDSSSSSSCSDSTILTVVLFILIAMGSGALAAVGSMVWLANADGLALRSRVVLAIALLAGFVLLPTAGMAFFLSTPPGTTELADRRIPLDRLVVVPALLVAAVTPAVVARLSLRVFEPVAAGLGALGLAASLMLPEAGILFMPYAILLLGAAVHSVVGRWRSLRVRGR